MFRKLFLLSLATLTAAGVAAQDEPAEIVVNESEVAKTPENLSYAIGVWTAQQLKMHLWDVKLEEVMKGMTDVAEEKKLRFSEEQVNPLIREAQTRIRDAELSSNKKKGEAFLEANAKEYGVNVTDSGLQYRVIEEGEGASPAPEDTVKVHYVGKFINGDTFDSSYDRGQPAEFTLNQVISGWTEGLQLMKEGAKYKFFIPYELAYGEAGRPPQIPPASVLVFEVELLEVQSS